MLGSSLDHVVFFNFSAGTEPSWTLNHLMLGGCGNVLYYQTPLMVRHMQGVITETTRTIHDQSVREPTARRSGAVERTEQHGSTTSIGVVTRRRHPQEHDERFS